MAAALALPPAAAAATRSAAALGRGGRAEGSADGRVPRRARAHEARVHRGDQRARRPGAAARSASARRSRRSSAAGPGRFGFATSVRALHARVTPRGILVTGIGPDRNRGQRGWVYKVGRRAATAGAGDTGGPFGRGRLRARQRVTWFYCVRAADCQRTLDGEHEAGHRRDRRDRARLRRRRRRRAGRGRARDRRRRSPASPGPTAACRWRSRPGTHRLVARKDGLVRSFTERVEVP